MNSKTFGVIVGVIVSLAIAMFVGLYMLGLSGQGHAEQAAGYYDTAADDGFYYQDDALYTQDGEFYFDEQSVEVPLQ